MIDERILPEYLKYDIDEIKGKNMQNCTYFDCLLSELSASINIAFHDGVLSLAEADYLREKYIWYKYYRKENL